MKLLKNKRLIFAGLTALVATGCSSIGQPELTCERLEKGGVCAGPMDIYELTNSRDSLENLTLEELDAQVNKMTNTSSIRDKSKDDVVMYKERSLEQHDTLNYQKAEVIPQTRFETSIDTGFGAWPNNGEPLAPEALAVMSEPEAMRIQVFAYSNDAGNLVMPGYIYVQTQTRTWGAGRDANLRPSRVIPLEMVKEGQQNLQRVEQSRNGVSSLGVDTQGNN